MWRVSKFAITLAVVLALGCSNAETPGVADSGAVVADDGDPRPERPDAAEVVFRCYPGLAVSGLAAGRPLCRQVAPDGIAPAWDGVHTGNNFTCPTGYSMDLLHFECGCSNNTNWSVCYLPTEPAVGPSKYSPPDVADFECPRGSLLRGFDDAGQPLCKSDTTIPLGSGIGPYWDGVFSGNNFSCPVGYSLQMHHFECGCSNNATWAVCVRGPDSELDHTLSVQVTQRADLLDAVCGPGQLVIGFAADDRPVCESVPSAIPTGFGVHGEWDGVFTGNNFACPDGFASSLHHYECGCSNNATWNACIAP